MGRRLHLVHPVLPPSENHIRQPRWTRGKGGKPKQIGMCYTPEAEGYRRAFREAMRTEFFVEIQKFRREHEPWHTYSGVIHYHFPPEEILNKSWLASGKSKAKSPYKRMDVGNRRKLLEDCVAEAVDIDDSLSFRLELVKLVADDTPRVEIFLEYENPVCFGVPPEYLR